MDLTIETLPWHDRRHHRRGGFQNPGYDDDRPVSLWKGLSWSARRIFHDKTHVPPPVQRPDTLALRRRPERLRVTWLGHTTVLIQTPDLTLLTDPIFSRRASPVTFAGPSRFIPPALSARDLPEVDVVLLSHDHYDHCDRTSIEELHRRFEPAFFVPLGVAELLRGWGLKRVAELDWWQRATLRRPGTGGPLRLTCTPARHFSGRSLFDRDATLWASWMIEAPAANPGRDANGNGVADENPPADTVRVYFGGDTGDGSHFAEIGERLAPAEVALLPIGAFQPRALMAPVHIGPVEAVAAFQALGATDFVPTHWGTFDLSAETVQAPAELLREIVAREGLSSRIRIPNPGEVLSFRTASSDELSTSPAHAPEADAEGAP